MGARWGNHCTVSEMLLNFCSLQNCKLNKIKGLNKMYQMTFSCFLLSLQPNCLLKILSVGPTSQWCYQIVACKFHWSKSNFVLWFIYKPYHLTSVQTISAWCLTHSLQDHLVECNRNVTAWFPTHILWWRTFQDVFKFPISDVFCLVILWISDFKWAGFRQNFIIVKYFRLWRNS